MFYDVYAFGDDEVALCGAIAVMCDGRVMDENHFSAIPAHYIKTLQSCMDRIGTQWMDIHYKVVTVQ